MLTTSREALHARLWQLSTDAADLSPFEIREELLEAIHEFGRDERQQGRLEGLRVS